MEYLIIAGFPFFFAGMWILVSFIISRLGWARLAARYATEEKFTGKYVGLISASINMMSYRNALTLRYDEKGFYLKPLFLFRMFHKPLLIPWTEIKEVRPRKLLFFESKDLVIGDPVAGKINLEKSTFNKLEHEWLRHSALIPGRNKGYKHL